MIRFWSKSLACEKGMSLVSVTIAAGIMGVIALAMMKMQDNQLKSQNDMIVRNEMMTFMNKLSGYLSKDDYCAANFEGMTIDEGSNISLDEVINPVKRVLYKTGEKYGNNAFRLLSIKQKEFFYDNDKKSSGVLKLMVSMEKTKKATGAKIINKEIDIFLYFNPEKEVYACGDGINLNTDVVKDPGIDVKEIKRAIETAAKADADTQKEMAEAIENNPTLKLLQGTSKTIQESNAKFKELEDERLKEAGRLE